MNIILRLLYFSYVVNIDEGVYKNRCQPKVVCVVGESGDCDGIGWRRGRQMMLGGGVLQEHQHMRNIITQSPSVATTGYRKDQMFVKVKACPERRTYRRS